MPTTVPQKIKRFLWLVILILVLIGAGYSSVRYYGFIFAKTIKGKIVKVEKVSPVGTLITGGGSVPAEQLFSFAVAIKADNSDEIHTASSEDRQWAVAQIGQCAEAKFFPYAPWELDKAGTYYGARLLRLFDCQ
jgi:hypothetical protein